MAPQDNGFEYEEEPFDLDMEGVNTSGDTEGGNDFEEEPFDVEEDPFEVAPARPGRRASRGYEDEDLEDELDDEVDEYERDPNARRGSRQGLEAVVAGMSPQTLKLALGAVLGLAVLLVVVATVYKKKKGEADEKARRKAFVQRALKHVADLHSMGIEYFTNGNREPDGFRERFTTQRDELILGVIIERQKPNSATFDTALTALNHEVGGVGEYAQVNPKPISGTHVFRKKGRAAIKLDEYEVWIFRQKIMDQTDRPVGRVTLLMFPEPE